jgi:hypothetical protein
VVYFHANVDVMMSMVTFDGSISLHHMAHVLKALDKRLPVPEFCGNTTEV